MPQVVPVGDEVPPICKVLYNENCLFEESEESLLFNNRNYKVSASVGSMDTKMSPVNCVFNLGAAPNIM